VNDQIGVEVWRGGVNIWECDEMGHMNVRFYVARAMEGLVGLADALGLEGAFRRNAQATFLLKDQHIRFLREARPRGALHMTAGVVAIGEDQARLLLLLVHSETGEISASFQTVVSHVTTAEARAFPWSDRTRARAAELTVAVPPSAAPRSLILDGVQETMASIAEADRLGLIRLGAGAIGGGDCDVFGRMRPELFIGRVSDGVPRLAGVFRGDVVAGEAERPARLGGAVLEYRLLHWAWPRAGDRFEIRSGLAGVDARTQRMVHWMLDPVTGGAWGTSQAVAIALDLDARKIVPISPEAQARIACRITPGLTL